MPATTYNGWTIVIMPSTPAPKSVEFTNTNIVGVSTSPFTGQQQIQDWGASYLEAKVTMPPMSASDAQAWVSFFLSCRGQANVFQLANAAFLALIPSGTVPGTYWRLKTNTQKWSVSEGIVYGFNFEIREAT